MGTQTPSASMLTPQQIQMLLEMGIDPEQYLNSGQKPPMTVGDTISQPMNPMFGMQQGLDIRPDPQPQIGVNPQSIDFPSQGFDDTAPPDQPQMPPPSGGLAAGLMPPPQQAPAPQQPPAEDPGIIAKVLGGLGSISDPAKQGLIATGLGILGAQGTRGSTLAAVGQGGLTGMAAYDYAKRTEDVKKAAEQKRADDLDAAKLKKIEYKLSYAQKLADDGNVDAANAIIKNNPDVQDYIKSMGTGVFFKGKPDKLEFHANDATGEHYSFDPISGKETLISKVTPTPREGPDPYRGYTNEDLANLPNTPGYDPGLPTGAPHKVRLDPSGKVVASIGAAPLRAGAGTYVTDTDGNTTIASPGQKMPAAIETAENNTIQRTNNFIASARNLKDVLDQGNIGARGGMATTMYGVAANVLPKPVADYVASMRSKTDPKANPGLFDDNLSATKVLSEAAVTQYAEVLMPPGARGAPSKQHMDNARHALGFDLGVPSAGDISKRLDTAIGMATATQQRAQATYSAYGKEPPVGADQYQKPPAGPGAPPPRDQDRKAREALEKQGYTDKQIIDMLAAVQ